MAVAPNRIRYFHTLIIMELQTTTTPHSQEPYVTRTYPSIELLDGIIHESVTAQRAWNAIALADRIAIGRKFTVFAKLLLLHL